MIRRSEQVEKEPCSNEREQKDERERMREKRESEDRRKYCQIVYSEVGDVFTDAKSGVCDGEWTRKGCFVCKFEPRTSMRDCSVKSVVEAREECVECWCRERGWKEWWWCHGVGYCGEWEGVSGGHGRGGLFIESRRAEHLYSNRNKKFGNKELRRRVFKVS